MFELHFLAYILLIAAAMLSALHVGKEALIALITVEAVFISLMLNHRISFLGISTEPSEALLVSAGLGLNLVHEYFGHQAVKKSIATSSMIAFFFNCALYFHITYDPSISTCLVPLIALTPRLIGAAFASFFVSQNIEASLYTALMESKHFKNTFIVRNYIVAFVGQACDTLLFTLFALYGTHESLVHFMLNSYALKALVILMATPFLLLSKLFMKTSTHAHAEI